jgi:predicted DNA-binding protein
MNDRRNIVFRLPVEVRDELEAYAKKEERNVSQVIRMAIKMFLEVKNVKNFQL